MWPNRQCGWGDLRGYGVSKSLPVGGISDYRGEATSQYLVGAGGGSNQRDTASGSHCGPRRTAAEEIHEL